VTAAWWALALWPVPGETPEWLARTRWVCFNAGPNGLPDASGWLLLIGQPIGMIAVLMVGWGGSLRAGLRSLAGAGWGRVLLAGGGCLLLVGLAAAGARVVQASASDVFALPGDELPPDTYPRLDRDAPRLGLVDQFGERLDLERLSGRPALLTFAFGHCATVCPMIVRQSVEAQERVRERVAAGEVPPSRVPRVVIVTLDPWRDTPSRLPSMAESWKVSEDAFVLSGGVEEVNDALDRWNVARTRNPQSGDVVHPPLVYVLDASGRIAYASSGGVPALVELLGRS